jgi:DNA-binding CsgD family transcriptional regulator
MVVVVAPSGPRELVRINVAAYGLSEREREIAKLVLRAYSTRQISRTLYISESTVQGHLSHIFEKVGVRSRREFLKRLFFSNLPPGGPSSTRRP